MFDLNQYNKLTILNNLVLFFLNISASMFILLFVEFDSSSSVSEILGIDLKS